MAPCVFISHGAEDTKLYSSFRRRGIAGRKSDTIGIGTPDAQSFYEPSFEQNDCHDDPRASANPHPTATGTANTQTSHINRDPPSQEHASFGHPGSLRVAQRRKHTHARYFTSVEKKRLRDVPRADGESWKDYAAAHNLTCGSHKLPASLQRWMEQRDSWRKQSHGKDMALMDDEYLRTHAKPRKDSWSEYTDQFNSNIETNYDAQTVTGRYIKARCRIKRVRCLFKKEEDEYLRTHQLRDYQTWREYTELFNEHCCSSRCLDSVRARYIHVREGKNKEKILETGL